MNKKINSFSKLFTPTLSAVFFMILSGIFATSMHCLIRFATEEHHPFEVAFFRTIFVLLIFLPVVLQNGFKSLKPNNIKLQSFRAVIGSVAMLFMLWLKYNRVSKSHCTNVYRSNFCNYISYNFFKGSCWD